MKKEYVAPTMVCEEFVANEYVAACYKIKCTTPNKNSTYYYVYDDTNNNGVWDSGDKQLYSNRWGFSGCNKWHKGVIQDEAPVANGFVTKGTNVNRDSYASVFYWYEDLHADADIHVMVPGKENYETNPNAS